MTRRAREEVVIGDYCFPPGTFSFSARTSCITMHAFFPSRRRSSRPDGRPHPRLAPPGMPICLFGGGRVSASAKDLRMEGLLVLTTLAQTWRMELRPALPWRPGGW